MKKWMFVSACVLCLGTAPLPVMAAGFAEVIVSELQQQGYSRIVTEQTWLGRVRIVAQRDTGSREIILNPRTGEILRDLWLLKDGNSGRGKDSQIVGDDDSDADEDRDDDRDDDNDSGGGDDDSDDDSDSDDSDDGESSGSGSSGSDGDDDDD